MKLITAIGSVWLNKSCHWKWTSWLSVPLSNSSVSESALLGFDDNIYTHAGMIIPEVFDWEKEEGGGWEVSLFTVILWLLCCWIQWVSLLDSAEQTLCCRYTLQLFLPRSLPCCHFWVVLGGVRLRVSLSTTGKVACFRKGIVTWLIVWRSTLPRPGRPHHHVTSPM